MREIAFHPIGVIHSPFKDTKDMPIQPSGAKGIAGTIVLNDDYVEGLKDLDGFSHIILIYHFHLSTGYSLMVHPFLDDKLHGVFATRAPKRPNHIGISVVKLEKIDGNILYVENIDIIDGTPLLDIKPYVGSFDNVKDERKGWLSDEIKNPGEIRSDDRFK